MNETVDADALDALVEHAPADARWPEISFAYAGVRVRATPDGTVTVTHEPPPNDERWPHVTPVDAEEGADVAMAVVFELAARSGTDPALVRSTLEGIVDLEALASLNRDRANGIARTGATVRFSAFGQDVAVSPTETISMGSTLGRLKQRGGNVLVVGAVPDALVDAVSSTLLGASGAGHRHLFALLDRDLETVSERLGPPTLGSPSPTPSGPTHVVNHATTSRSATEPQVSAGTPPPSVTDVSGDVDAFASAVADALSDLGGDDGGDSASVRVCLDSLRPVLESRDEAGVRAFLEPIYASVRETAALAHYVLPVERDTPAVAALEDAFDATVELRINATVPEQRWHLRDGAYTTPWFAVDDR
ncbi:hypothetical protein GCM10025298_24520 [Natronobiforma cellulositropha]